MSDLRHAVLAGGFAAIAAVRADRWLRPLAQGIGVILTFHHVRPDADAGEPARGFRPNRSLAVTPAFLETVIEEVARAGFAFAAIDELPARLAAATGRGDGPPFAVITFDDGYRDNIEHAWPILRRHNVPWTLYVVPAFAEGLGVLWWADLERAIARSDTVSLTVCGEEMTLPASTPAQKLAAFEQVAARLRRGGRAALRAFVSELAEREGRDPGATARALCAGWSEIAALACDPLVTIGAHSMSHPVLACESVQDAGEELARCRAVVAARLGRPVDHLAYPHGDGQAAGTREFALACAAGYATAVTTRPGHLWAGHAAHRHALPRVSINGRHQSRAALRALLSGVPFVTRSRPRV